MPNPHRQAATAELREFLTQMRGKSPKEMLGAIASSNLIQSTIIATAAITATLVLCTIIPFASDRIFGDKSGDQASKTPAPSSTGPLETPAEPSIDGTNDGAASKLGIGESKDAPANVNPLESSTGDLLDGLE